MRKLTSSQLKQAAAAIYIINEAGKQGQSAVSASFVISTPRGGVDVGPYMINRIRSDSSKQAIAAKIRHELIYHEMHDISQALLQMSIILDSFISKPLDILIAGLCNEYKIFWDDTAASNKTTYEIDNFKQSEFGKRLVEYECFLSQQLANQAAANARQQRVLNKVMKAANINVTPQASKPTSTPAAAAQTSSATASVPSNTTGMSPYQKYKNSGPQSGNLLGLVGPAGQKITLSQDYLYAVCGPKIAGKISTLFARPIASLPKSDANRVFFGSTSNFANCGLFFINAAEADQAKVKAQNANIAPSDAQVVKIKTDKNGYYRINTAVGLAYIRALLVNEGQMFNEPQYEGYDIQNYEAYKDAYCRYE